MWCGPCALYAIRRRCLAMSMKISNRTLLSLTEIFALLIVPSIYSLATVLTIT